MTAHFTAKLSARWVEREADGCTCYNCGDIAWLKHWVMEGYIEGSEFSFDIPGVVFCDSCFDAVGFDAP